MRYLLFVVKCWKKQPYPHFMSEAKGWAETDLSVPCQYAKSMPKVNEIFDLTISDT